MATAEVLAYLCYFLFGDIRWQAADVDTGVLFQLKPFCLLGSSLFGLLGSVLLPLYDILPTPFLTLAFAFAFVFPIECFVICAFLSSCDSRDIILLLQSHQSSTSAQLMFFQQYNSIQPARQVLVIVHRGKAYSEGSAVSQGNSG